MSQRTSRSRIFWRERGGVPRAYADFRSVGGKREPLKVQGEKLATSDPTIADALYAQRLTAYQQATLRAVHGLPQPVTLAVYAADHLRKKAQANRVTVQALEADQRHLERATAFFGAARDLGAIEVEDVADWIAALRDRGFGNDTIRHHLHSLSNTFRRAQAEKKVPLGFNPVSACEKPSGVRRESRWLEVDEAALLLEAARTYRAKCA